MRGQAVVQLVECTCYKVQGTSASPGLHLCVWSGARREASHVVKFWKPTLQCWSPASTSVRSKGGIWKHSEVRNLESILGLSTFIGTYLYIRFWQTSPWIWILHPIMQLVVLWTDILSLSNLVWEKVRDNDVCSILTQIWGKPQIELLMTGNKVERKRKLSSHMYGKPAWWAYFLVCYPMSLLFGMLLPSGSF